LDLALDDLSNIKELIFIYKGYTSDQRYNYELIHNAILLEFAQLGFASMLYNVGRSLETEDYTSYCRTYNGLDHAVAIITEQINLIKLTFKSSEMQKSHVLYEWEECLYNLKEWKQLFLMSMDLIDLLDMFMDTLDDLNERKLISSSDKKNLVAVCLELQHKTRNKEDVHEDKEYINYEELVIKLKHNWINLIEFPNLLLNVIQIQHEEQHLHEFFEALGD